MNVRRSLLALLGGVPALALIVMLGACGAEQQGGEVGEPMEEAELPEVEGEALELPEEEELEFEMDPDLMPEEEQEGEEEEEASADIGG